jgi:transposase
MRIFLEIEVRRMACRKCGAVKRERLDFLADNPRYTQRFAFYVGKRCRSASHAALQPREPDHRGQAQP